MVYDRAHELAMALARCEEYKRLEIAKAGIANDSAAKRMVKDFLTRKMELELAAMSGKERDQSAMAALEQLAGVHRVLPGYMGGADPAPTYERVCSGTTGHAEVVQVTFDPAVIDYATLLDVFFTIHDPTTLNRQGHDVGSQYRSAIFYHDDNQQQQATTLIDTLNASGLFPSPIVTEVTPAGIFYPAENYHQSYYLQHPQEPYCQAVIAPKLHKFQQLFNHLRRAG